MGKTKVYMVNLNRKKLPTISIITCTYNANLQLFKEVLKALKSQTYPKKLIEHIVVDGGSTNNTVKLARSYNCKVVVRSDLKVEEQVRANIGFNMANGQIFLIIQADNIVTSKNWFKKMVQPFLENKNIFCTFSAYNGYKKNMAATTRYCALIGANDPTIYYLNKTEKIRMDQTQYNKGKIVKETKDYYVVQFNKNNLPTLGDNGHMFLKSAMKKVAKDPKHYMHTDAFSELLNLGYDTFGVVKNSLIHAQIPNLIQSAKRRVEVKEKFYDKYRGKRKYLVYNPNSLHDRINLVKYIFFSLTIIVPLMESIRGYFKIRDRAWFLHPIICLLMVTGYGISEIRWFIKKLFL